MKLSVSKIGGLKLTPGKAEEIVFDSELPGFGIRLREAGSRTFVFQYKLGDKQRRMSLGKATASTLDGARKSAKKLYARVQIGEDPAGEKVVAKATAAETFEATIIPYLAWQKTRRRMNGVVGLKPRSLEEIDRHLLTHAKPLHKLQLSKIRRADIAACIGTVGKNSGEIAGNRVRTTLSGLFSWAMTEGLVESNPVVGTRRHEEAERDRVLGDDELRAIWSSLSDDHYGAIVKLLALTGQRKGEIAGLQWSEIKDGVIELPGERTKNHRPHTVPLSEPASAILVAQPKRTDNDGRPRDLIFGFGDGPFSGWSGCKEALDARITEAAGRPLDDWVLHDLRRTVATRMADLGVQPHVIEALLNHVSGHKAGVAGIYNRSTYERETTAALGLWGEHLMAIVQGRKSKILPLRKA
jgi:integrase